MEVKFCMLLTFGLYGCQADGVRGLSCGFLWFDHMSTELAWESCRDGGLEIERRARLHDGSRWVWSNCNSVCLRIVSRQVGLELKLLAAVDVGASRKSIIYEQRRITKQLQDSLVTALPVRGSDSLLLLAVLDWTFLQRIDVVLSQTRYSFKATIFLPIVPARLTQSAAEMRRSPCVPVGRGRWWARLAGLAVGAR